MRVIGQAARSRRFEISASVAQGCGSVLSLDSLAGSGTTLTTTAGSRPRGTMRHASPASRVPPPTLSVCVIWQWGVSVIVQQLTDAPVATLPVKLPTEHGFASGAPAPKCRGPAAPNSTAIARLTPRSSAARTFCPPYESSACTLAGSFHDRAAHAAGEMRGRAEETFEDRRQLRLDVGDLGEFLVQLVAAGLAVPLEAVALAGPPDALDHQANGVGGPARRMRHVRRQ